MMGLILIFTIFLVLGIMLAFNDEWSELGPMLASVGALALLICGIIVLANGATGKTLVALYQNDKAYISTSYENEQLTNVERSEILKTALKDNQIITKAKLWRDDFWISWFVYHPIGDLEPFDLDKIAKSRTLIRVEN